MKLAGDFVFDAPVGEVWKALLDPVVLAATMPGCEKLEIVNGQYVGDLNIKVGPVQGKFTGKIDLEDIAEEKGYTIKVDGRGAPGFVNAVAKVVLEGQGEKTRIQYDADANVGGKIASVGQRLLDASAKAIIKQSLEGLNENVKVRAAHSAAVAAAQAAQAAQAAASGSSAAGAVNASLSNASSSAAPERESAAGSVPSAQNGFSPAPASSASASGSSASFAQSTPPGSSASSGASSSLEPSAASGAPGASFSAAASAPAAGSAATAAGTPSATSPSASHGATPPAAASQLAPPPLIRADASKMAAAVAKEVTKSLIPQAAIWVVVGLAVIVIFWLIFHRPS